VCCAQACLEASGWDLDKAYDALRKKGLAAAAKKASRHAAEGLVGVEVQGTSAAAIVEVNSETDFVARNDLFRKLVRQVAAAALALQPANPATHEVDLQQVQAHAWQGIMPGIMLAAVGPCQDTDGLTSEENRSTCGGCEAT
jgi:translation elongation factor EF-Ts